MDTLPVELWMAVISHMSRKDLVQFRLCSSHTLLPFINQFLFENLYIKSGAEDEPMAASRMLAVSKSNVAQHVRVLELQIVSGQSYGECLLVFLVLSPGLIFP
jgi:hypothetical protein